MIDFTIEVPPASVDDELRQYLNRQFHILSEAIRHNWDFEVTHNLPEKYEDGMIRYFGTTNITITSVGFWGYENGTWVKL